MNIYSLFKDSRDQFPDNKALVVKDREFSYRELSKISETIATALKHAGGSQVGIFAYRSLSAYAGILGTLQAGKTYVPLNPKFPLVRNEKILRLSQSRSMIVDNSCINLLEKLLHETQEKFILVFPEASLGDLPEGLRSHEIYTKENLKEGNEEVVLPDGDKNAYILFTSGSTGDPKGVPVTHENVHSYIDYLKKRYEITDSDRFSQTFDITFDLSVHDMFLAWSSGAALYVVPDELLMAPAKFIKSRKLTMWFSVPSLAQFMSRFRMLKPGAFPDLRYSFFCGEPLPKSTTINWKKAAENSIVENIYGPTEATIGITHYRIPDDEEKIKEKNGIVAIGNVFETQDWCLLNEENKVVETEGELCLSGSQVTKGYWKNEEKTREQFIGLSGKMWYKTGDLVRLEDNMLFYLSRKDFQVKIRGYRIELDEINKAIADFTGTTLVFTVPYPVNSGIAENMYSFVSETSSKPKSDILNELARLLPEYMIPKDILFIKDFPLNYNGKIDRAGLTKHLENQEL